MNAKDICLQRLTALGKAPQSSEERIDQKELLRKLLPEIYSTALSFKEEFPLLRVRNPRLITLSAKSSNHPSVAGG